MKAISRKYINPIKMATNPPEEIVNSGYKVINSDGFIYEYVGIGWIKTSKAEKEDYQNIPQLVD
jgi:hypothetical protein